MNTPIDARELKLTMDNTERLWLVKEQLRRARAPYQTWVEFLTDHVLRQAVANGGTADDSTHHAIKRLADGLTRTVADTLQAMGTLTSTDTMLIHTGYAQGNYDAAYETEDYNAAVAAINGSNGFYRVGHLLGFFSSFELHEILDPTVRAEVEHYRAVVAALDIGLGGE
jgi:hypothetical protein